MKKIVFIFTLIIFVYFSHRSFAATSVPEPDWGPYMMRMEKKIKRNWNPPKTNQSRRTVMLFKIDRSGKLLSIKTLKKADFRAYDKAAYNAVVNAAPFGPTPVEFKDKSINVEFTFDYNVYADSGNYIEKEHYVNNCTQCFEDESSQCNYSPCHRFFRW